MTITEIKLTSPFHVDLTATFNCHFNNLINVKIVFFFYTFLLN